MNPPNEKDRTSSTNFLEVSRPLSNTSCVSCGKPIYFYQAENGGGVDFDEIGPPWIKHFCTGEKENKEIAPSISRNKKSDWQVLSNFKADLLREKRGIFVRLRGNDAFNREKRFFFKIEQELYFDVCLFADFFSGVKISAIGHNQFGEFFVCEGYTIPGECYLLDIRAIVNSGAKDEIVKKISLHDFFMVVGWGKTWTPIKNLNVDFESGSLYRVTGGVGSNEVIFRVRMNDGYNIRHAGFRDSSPGYVNVLFLADDPKEKNSLIVLEGFASIRYAFPPHSKLEIKDSISWHSGDISSSLGISSEDRGDQISIYAKNKLLRRLRLQLIKISRMKSIQA